MIVQLFYYVILKSQEGKSERFWKSIMNKSSLDLKSFLVIFITYWEIIIARFLPCFCITVFIITSAISIFVIKNLLGNTMQQNRYQGFHHSLFILLSLFYVQVNESWAMSYQLWGTRVKVVGLLIRLLYYSWN